jgi:RimJ/RimL family protein N-acetyltransferase
MESTIFTLRLKLTLIEKAQRGSKQLAWLHELRSNEKATWWRYVLFLRSVIHVYRVHSIAGQSKTLEDTEKTIESVLPTPGTYRVAYAIHEIDPTSDADGEERPARFIGLIVVRSLGGANDLVLPAHLFPSSSFSSSVLNVEIGYSFLPTVWSRGFATESVTAVLSACRRAKDFWAPFERVYMCAIVNVENLASLGVMRKSGMGELGVWEWTGKEIWLAGKWRDKGYLCVWGMWLVE